MIKASDLIALWRRALDEGWGYIYGTAGQLWTAADQAAMVRRMVSAFGENWKKDENAKKSVYYKAALYGDKWIGKRVADCSGLAVWAFRQLGGSVYHGSNTIWNQYVTGRCELKNGTRTDGDPILPGDPVFLVKTENGKKNRHHIGYYVGDGICIEAKGTYYGVVTSQLSHWHETAHWLDVEYEGEMIFVARPILRKGDSGSDVRKLQEMLYDYGYDLAVDGKFGDQTKQAVENFQKEMHLQVDGIVGDKTWAALDGGYETPAVPVGMVQIPKDEWETIKKIVNKY